MLGDLTTCLVLSVVGEAAVTSREQTYLPNDNHLVHQQAHQMHQQVHLVHQQVEQDALSARYTQVTGASLRQCRLTTS